jgi:predicted NAD/FAD-dependent oxidoreductase
MTHQDVVIVGAGMAGIVCGRRLQHAGYTVCLVEKSRGIGGRMATRRVEGVPLDHGARFLQPHGEKLTALIQHLQRQDLLQLWHPHTYQLEATGQLHSIAMTSPCYVAPDGMSTLGKALAADLPIHRQQRAIAIAPAPNGTWHLTTETGDTDHPVQHWHTKALVLAMPAPQILPLLATLPPDPRVTAALENLKRVTYTPCITVLAEYDSSSPTASTSLPCPPTTPWMIMGHPASPFFWVGLDSSKRSPAPRSLNIILQSSADFATPWLETTNLQPAGEDLLKLGGQFFASWLAKPQRWQVHRWRYSLVESPALTSCVQITYPAPLVGCGDWGGDRALESALESGWEAAAIVHHQLGRGLLPDFPMGLF